MDRTLTAPAISIPKAIHACDSDITAWILETVKRSQACEMEELVRACPSYTWNQVFLEVDRLSRTGELRLLPKRAGVYAVTLPAA